MSRRNHIVESESNKNIARRSLLQSIAGVSIIGSLSGLSTNSVTAKIDNQGHEHDSFENKVAYVGPNIDIELPDTVESYEADALTSSINLENPTDFDFGIFAPDTPVHSMDRQTMLENETLISHAGDGAEEAALSIVEGVSNYNMSSLNGEEKSPIERPYGYEYSPNQPSHHADIIPVKGNPGKHNPLVVRKHRNLTKEVRQDSNRMFFNGAWMKSQTSRPDHYSKIVDALNMAERDTRGQLDTFTHNGEQENKDDKDEDPDGEFISAEPKGAGDRWVGLGLDEDFVKIEAQLDTPFNEFTVDVGSITKSVWGGFIPSGDNGYQNYDMFGFRAKTVMDPERQGEYRGRNTRCKRKVDFNNLTGQERVTQDGPKQSPETNIRSTSIGVNAGSSGGDTGIGVSGSWSWSHQQGDVVVTRDRVGQNEGAEHQWDFNQGARKTAINADQGIRLRVKEGEREINYDVLNKWMFTAYKRNNDIFDPPTGGNPLQNIKGKQTVFGNWNAFQV